MLHASNVSIVGPLTNRLFADSRTPVKTGFASVAFFTCHGYVTLVYYVSPGLFILVCCVSPGLFIFPFLTASIEGDFPLSLSVILPAMIYDLLLKEGLLLRGECWTNPVHIVRRSPAECTMRASSRCVDCYALCPRVVCPRYHPGCVHNRIGHGSDVSDQDEVRKASSYPLTCTSCVVHCAHLVFVPHPVASPFCCRIVQLLTVYL